MKSFHGFFLVKLLFLVLLIIIILKFTLFSFKSISLDNPTSVVIHQEDDSKHEVVELVQVINKTCSCDIEIYKRVKHLSSHSFTTGTSKESAYNYSLDTTSLWILPIPKVIYQSQTIQEDNSLQRFISLSLHLDWNIQYTLGKHSKVNNRKIENDLNDIINRFCLRSFSKQNQDIRNLFIFNTINIIVSDILLDGFLRNENFLSSNEWRNSETSKYEEEERIDEYILFLHDNGEISIYCSHKNGFIASLASLSQLLANPWKPISIPLMIHDWSVNQWRGLMIDVARHFQPIPLLQRAIDAMELSKLNVLHLHLTDSQSFPLILDFDKERNINLTLLGTMGSFDSYKRYSKDDMKALIHYAAQRGIEIVPEIDFPAHTLSFSKAFPGITTSCPKFASRQQTPHNIYTLDLFNPLSKQLVHGILEQLIEVFPSKYIHVGGDEVEVQCWLESIDFIRNMTQQNLTVRDVFYRFEKDVFDFVRIHGRIPMVWQGVLDTNVIDAEEFHRDINGKQRGDTDHRIIIQPWKCWSGLALRAAVNAFKSNHPSVMAACWYLDYDSDWLTLLSSDLLFSAITSTESLRKVSMLQNITSKPEESADYFFGGEGAMWTELVDHCNLECRMWPRAVAIATRLWGYELGQPLELPFPSSRDTRLLNSFSRNLFQNDLSILQRHKTSRNLQMNSPVLSIPQIQQLYLSFIRFRFYLLESLFLAPADVYLHKVMKSKSTSNLFSSRNTFTPILISKEEEAFPLLSFHNSTIAFASYNPSLPSTSLHEGDIRITSRCLGIPEAIQRPVSVNHIQVAQLNVAEGSTGKRGFKMLEWLQHKANAGFLLVGFCELNGWQEVESTSDIYKNKPKIAFKAASAGFPYFHVLENDQPYNLGIVSTLPFEIVAEYGPPQFQRGVLHIFYRTLNLHVIIVHLHAHSSKQREVEAHLITNIIQPILSNKKNKLMIMGDFNTLSPWDSENHENIQLNQFFQRSDHSVFQRLQKKFLVENQENAKNEINYEPMSILLRAGLHDSCIVACNNSITLETNQSFKLDSIMRDCLRKFCPFTEPTSFNPEWNELQQRNISHPEIRLDFILVSSNVFEKKEGTYCQDTNEEVTYPFQFHSQVDINNETREISDHFPVIASFPYISKETQDSQDCQQSFPLY